MQIENSARAWNASRNGVCNGAEGKQLKRRCPLPLNIQLLRSFNVARNLLARVDLVQSDLEHLDLKSGRYVVWNYLLGQIENTENLIGHFSDCSGLLPLDVPRRYSRFVACLIRPRSPTGYLMQRPWTRAKGVSE